MNPPPGRMALAFISLASASLVVGSVAMAAGMPSRALTVGAPTRFMSCSALKSRIVSARQGTGYGGVGIMKRAMPLMAPMAANDLGVSAISASAEAAPSGATTQAYSTTNVQVEGVDEADMIKQDGDYVYHLTKNRLAISRSNPPTESALVSISETFDGFSPQDMYVEGNRLMLIGNGWDGPWNGIEPVPMGAMVKRSAMPIWRGRSLTRVEIYDITDRAHLKKLRTLDFDGNISSSRLINGRAYLVMNSWSNWSDGEGVNSTNLVPSYRDSAAGTTERPMGRCIDVAYFDRGPAEQFLAVASVPMSGTGDIKKNVILGSSETVYATTDSMYVARQDWSQPWLVDSLRPTSREKTQLYAFTLSDGNVRFRAKGQVPGHVLNQFSLDEFSGHLRVATTQGNVWDHANPSTSAVYTLDNQRLTQTGSVTGIAPGEQIYSIRFVGARAYMVTFKKTDPFFVIDLADATKPKILGKLKIPGYSDYLHPMDANHIIGFGKNAEDAAEGDFAWYQGLKLAVFDVTDVENPKQLWKTDIGDRGSDSPALHDHHAFLYDPVKSILALPVTVTKLSDEQKAQNSGSQYGDVVFQGALVFKLTTEKGFELLGRVSHVDDPQTYLKSSSWFSDPDHAIERVLINRDTLISASPSELQFHHLPDLSGYKAVTYPETKENPTDVILY